MGLFDYGHSRYGGYGEVNIRPYEPPFQRMSAAEISEQNPGFLVFAVEIADSLGGTRTWNVVWGPRTPGGDERIITTREPVRYFSEREDRVTAYLNGEDVTADVRRVSRSMDIDALPSVTRTSVTHFAHGRRRVEEYGSFF